RDSILSVGRWRSIAMPWLGFLERFLRRIVHRPTSPTFLKEETMKDNRTEKTEVAPKAKPVHEVRLGKGKAAVWANETETGVRHNVTVSRVYRDGEQWKTSDSFARDELLLLAKVVDLAHTWICEAGRLDDIPI